MKVGANSDKLDFNFCQVSGGKPLGGSSALEAFDLTEALAAFKKRHTGFEALSRIQATTYEGVFALKREDIGTVFGGSIELRAFPGKDGVVLYDARQGASAGEGEFPAFLNFTQLKRTLVNGLYNTLRAQAMTGEVDQARYESNPETYSEYIRHSDGRSVNQTKIGWLNSISVSDNGGLEITVPIVLGGQHLESVTVPVGEISIFEDGALFISALIGDSRLVHYMKPVK